jgi:hypothetical protein
MFHTWLDGNDFYKGSFQLKQKVFITLTQENRMQFDLSWPAIKVVFNGFSLFVLGMVIYCIFIFSFYKQVSKKYIFPFEEVDVKNSLHPQWRRFWNRLVYTLKYIFVVPLFLIVWFIILALLLLLMQKSIPLDTALLISMALLATIRITAYYNEELSVDVAKLVPLALLALFLVDMTTLSLPLFWEKTKSIAAYASIIIIYFIFIVLLELILRGYDAIANRED